MRIKKKKSLNIIKKTNILVTLYNKVSFVNVLTNMNKQLSLNVLHYL